MDGLKVFIGGDAKALKKTIREADYAIKGFVNQNKQALKSLEKLGAPSAIAFTGLTLGITAAAKKFGDFEATLNRVAAVSNASASEMAALKVKAEELGAATKFSGQEAASGMEELAKAGFNAKQTMDAIPGVLQLAAAGGVSVAQAAELAGGTIRGFGLAMDEAGRVADVMAQAANQSSVDIGDLQLTMKYVAPVASSASQSLEEMSGAIAIMGNSMIKGEQAGTTLRAALTRLQDPPKEAAETLGKLGIAVSDTEGKMLPLGDIVDQLRTKTAKMTEVQRNAAIAQIFGTEALSGMLTLVKSSPAEYEAMVASMRNADGAAKKMSDTINSGFNGSMDQLGASVESAALAISENLAPSILAVAGVVKGAADTFNSMPGPLKAFTVGALASGTALLGLVGAGGLLLPVLGQLRTALFAMNTLALTPVGLGVAALAVTVGLATMAFKAHADAVAAAKRKEDEARQARIDHTTQLAAQKTELEKLGKEYSRLADKAKLSKDEQARLKEIQDKLAKDYPEIAKVIAAGATAHDKVEAAVQREIAAKKDLLNLDRVAAQQRVMSAATDLANERRKLSDLRAQYEAVKSGPSYGDSAGRVQELNVIAGMIAAQERAVDSVNSRVLSSAAELQRVNGIVIPAPVAPRKTNRGAAVGGGSSSSSGKSAAEKAADELHQKQVDQLGKLSSAYQRNLQVAQAWGGGSAAEVNGLTKLIADIRSKGLDKIPEGYEAIINAETRLKAIQGERFVAGQKAAEAEAKTMAEGATQTAGVFNSLKALFGALGPVTDKMKELRDAKAAAEFRKSIRDMQGDLMALGADPSLERLANFTKDLTQDEEKLKSWGKAINDIGKAFKDAGGGADGFAAALTKVATGGLNPVSVGLTAVFGLAQAIKGAFDEAAKAQDRLRDSSASIAAEIRQLQAELSDDPRAKAEAARQRAIEDAQAKAKRDLDKLKADAKAGDATLPFKDFVFHGSLSKAIDDLRVEDIPEIWERLGLEIDKANQGFEEAVASAGQAGNAIERTAAQMTRGLEAAQKAADDTLDAYNRGIERLAEIDDELNRGERDDQGRKVSIAARAAADVAKQEADTQKKVADLRDRQLKAVQEIATINREEAEAVLAIENEGIAERARSEAQDKTLRISRVRAEAAEKRKAKDEEIVQIKDQIAVEEEQGRLTVDRIRFLANERIAALDAERVRMESNVSVASRQLEIERSITSEILRRQSGGAPVSSGGSGYNNLASSGAGIVRKQTYFHTGGTNVKSDETPAILRKNEFVLTPEQFTNLTAARGGQVINVGGIKVQAAPGMDVRAVADVVWNTFSARLQRKGVGR